MRPSSYSCKYYCMAQVSWYALMAVLDFHINSTYSMAVTIRQQWEKNAHSRAGRSNTINKQFNCLEACTPSVQKRNFWTVSVYKQSKGTVHPKSKIHIFFSQSLELFMSPNCFGMSCKDVCLLSQKLPLTRLVVLKASKDEFQNSNVSFQKSLPSYWR